MRPCHRYPRFYIDSGMFEGAELVVDKRQAHHLVHVLRMRVGEKILVFNGREGEWLAHIVETGKKCVRLRLGMQTRFQPLSSSLIYCFAPLKSARFDYMVQKAVEMGASVLQPVITHFTQGSKPDKARMQTHAIEAAQQCGLLVLPCCAPTVKLDEMLTHWPLAYGGGKESVQGRYHLIFCDEMLAEIGDDALTVLTELVRSDSGVQPALLIGPEGGFSDEERQRLHSLPFVTVIGLGRRILRADTAAVAAMALINAVFDKE